MSRPDDDEDGQKTVLRPLTGKAGARASVSANLTAPDAAGLPLSTSDAVTGPLPVSTSDASAGLPLSSSDAVTGPLPPGDSGPSAAQDEEDNALPIGTRIAEFEIKGLIGTGGFGIVYLAHDHSLGRDVALKEYLPASLAGRVDGLTVKVKADRHVGTFNAGLSSFINEARLLAQFDSPSLVKVYRFWNANGTAYMVMPFYEGPTLKQALLEMRKPPSEEWLKALLVPLVAALELLHRQNCFHRDIAPDNILLLQGGRPVLLDFGAARRVIEDKAKTLTVILKPGYAPIEQYADTPDMRQGAWTDVYALAAVVHYAMVGKPPPPSVSRIIKDAMVPLEQAAAGAYSAAFLKSVDQALAIRPEDRPQSMAELSSLLRLDTQAVEQAARQSSVKGAATGRKLPPSALWAGVAGAAAIAVAGGYFMLRPSAPGQPPAAAPVAAAPPVAPAPVVPPVAAEAGANVAGEKDAAAAAPKSSEPAAAVNMADALQQLHDGRDADHAVSVTTDKTRVRIGKDKLRFRIQSEKPGYLYVFMLGTEHDHINLLFPNSLDRNNRMSARQSLNLPRSGWAMTAGGPPGTNQFVAMVSDTPRDFSNAGLTNAGAFGEFPKDRVASLLRSKAAGADPALAGVAVCGSAAECSKAYGAAQFSIVEIQ